MSRNSIEEFTSVSGIPPVGVAGKGVPSNPKLRRQKRRPAPAIEAFLGLPTMSPVVETHVSTVVSQTPFPPKVVAVAAAPVVETVAPATSALMLSREVVEALSSGQSVTVRGVLLEPMFKPTQAKPAAVVTAQTEAAAAAILNATNLTESQAVGPAADMNAQQPPPIESTNGRAVSAVFRRWGGV